MKKEFINIESETPDLIDRKSLKEKIESLRMTLTGVRSGKTVLLLAMKEYKKSILRIIDEQPCYEKKELLKECYDVYFCEKTKGLEVGKEIRMDHKPTERELRKLMIKFKMRSSWYKKRYIYDPCAGCFGASNNDCQHCGYGGDRNE